MNEIIDNAELSVLGACLLEPDKVLPLAADKLEAQHFENRPLGAAYRSMLSMQYEGEPIDFVTLLPRLVSDGVPEEAGKILLVRAMEACPTTRNTEEYIKIVLNGYRKRRAAGIANELLYDSDGEIETAVTHAADELSELIKEHSSSGLTRMSDVIMREYAAMFDKSRLDNRIDLGYGCVDAILDGVYPGDMLVIGARPGVGKTALAITVARSVAARGKSVAFYNLEMSQTQQLYRYISSVSGVSLQKLKNADLDKDASQVAKGCDALYKLPLYLNDKAYMSVGEIRNECRFTKNLGLIVIDYLQLLQPRAGQKYPNRAEAVGQISRDLKILAKDLNVPVIVLSQLNRVNDEEKKPSMNDLRESGSIEQDADSILLLWNSDMENGYIGCKVAKNRNGGVGEACLYFDRKRMWFESTSVKPVEGKRREAWQ